MSQSVSRPNSLFLQTTNNNKRLEHKKRATNFLLLLLLLPSPFRAQLSYFRYAKQLLPAPVSSRISLPTHPPFSFSSLARLPSLPPLLLFRTPLTPNPPRRAPPSELGVRHDHSTPPAHRRFPTLSHSSPSPTLRSLHSLQTALRCCTSCAPQTSLFLSLSLSLSMSRTDLFSLVSLFVSLFVLAATNSTNSNQIPPPEQQNKKKTTKRKPHHIQQFLATDYQISSRRRRKRRKKKKKKKLFLKIVCVCVFELGIIIVAAVVVAAAAAAGQQQQHFLCH